LSPSARLDYGRKRIIDTNSQGYRLEFTGMWLKGHTRRPPSGLDVSMQERCPLGGPPYLGRASLVVNKVRGPD
jgi:hypothetical protein